jgi:hypothetical protein
VLRIVVMIWSRAFAYSQSISSTNLQSDMMVVVCEKPDRIFHPLHKMGPSFVAERPMFSGPPFCFVCLASRARRTPACAAEGCVVGAWPARDARQGGRGRAASTCSRGVTEEVLGSVPSSVLWGEPI